ncbi:hypothetical protein Avbf_19174 [Armadillidium vulgare]|nr:hypothetical protein Avbf_19174 [Armadillidium vulgare]
MSILYKVALY